MEDTSQHILHKKYGCYYLSFCPRVHVELLDCFCCYDRILEGRKIIFKNRHISPYSRVRNIKAKIQDPVSDEGCFVKLIFQQQHLHMAYRIRAEGALARAPTH